MKEPNPPYCEACNHDPCDCPVAIDLNTSFADTLNFCQWLEVHQTFKGKNHYTFEPLLAELICEIRSLNKTLRQIKNDGLR